MTHEIKNLIQLIWEAQQQGVKSVLATVVALEGSSYRRPGVRMLIQENGKTFGAVSGGCVEKEIIHRAKSVFLDNQAKIITYDGRYRLGCEGILYILIEPFYIENEFLNQFSKALKNRESIEINSFFIKNDDAIGNFGSQCVFQHQETHSFYEKFTLQTKNEIAIFTQILKPAFRLLIIGGEHDAVKLCKIAANIGWEIDVITSTKDPKMLTDFPGANSVIGETPETIQFENIEENTAIVVMNHSYVQDLKYVLQLSNYQPKYIGILGAPKRGERLFNELIELKPDLNTDFLDAIYTPAGLHIGAQTPEDIAVSIIAEIMSVFNKKEPFSLRNLKGKIHQ